MRAAITLSLVVLGSTLVAACEPKAPPPPKTAAPPSTPAPEAQRPQVPSTPATSDERKESTQPVQGQVDPKEAAQRKDFEPKK